MELVTLSNRDKTTNRKTRVTSYSDKQKQKKSNKRCRVTSYQAKQKQKKNK